MNTRTKPPVHIWDDFYVPSDVEDVWDYVTRKSPKLAKHDYALYTDGSGYKDGHGAWASVFSRTEKIEDERVDPEINKPKLKYAATYGSNVYTMELTALVNGLAGILQHEVECAIATGFLEDSKYTSCVSQYYTGPNRLRVMWFTDRQDMAKTFLYNECDEPLRARHSAKHLWASVASLNKHFVITPMFVGRNTVDYQAYADSICSACRMSSVNLMEHFIKQELKNRVWTPKTTVQKCYL